MQNFFEMFDLPIDFALDKNHLDKKFRELQSQYHPDLQDNIAKKTMAERYSSIINHAYQTLLNVDSRASYLLELQNNHQLSTLSESIHDLDFLDDAMDFRIALDDATVDTLPILQKKIAEWLISMSDTFVKAYYQQHWTKAQDATQKLKFLVKLEKDVQKKADELAYQHQNDDDLYV